MKYSKKLIEHFENPKNVGSFDDNEENVGTGLIGSPSCGDVLKFQIKVDPATNTIVDARFKTFGCGSAVASGSLISEWVKGRTLEEAAKVENRDIAAELELPPVKVHCSVMAREAIGAAIDDYKKRSSGEKQPSDEPTRTTPGCAAGISLCSTEIPDIKLSKPESKESEGGECCPEKC
jgi:nitrogen fixation protein NifU and related proteins